MKNYITICLILCCFSTANAQFGPFNDIVIGDVLDPLDMIPIDFDLDGDIDIVVRSDYGFSWHQNAGAETFEYPLDIYGIGLGTMTIDFAVTDFDLDGDYDLIVSNEGDTPSYLKNNGDGTFLLIFLVELTDLTFFEVVDFDDDGDSDIVGISAGSIIWFEGDGTGVIIDEHVLETGVVGELDFILADTDNDLDLDIIWTSTELGGAVYFIENLGGGLFDDRVTTDSGKPNPSSVCAADIDGDSDLDVVFGSGIANGKIYWNENIGGGAFGGSTLISDDHLGEMRVTSGDIDLDGDIDLVASSQIDGKVVWYENTGLAIFEGGSIMSNIVENATAVVVSDIDGDGDLDAFTQGVDIDRVGYFLNATLNPRHVEGRLFYDENENGIMDGAETGLPWATVLSDPEGTMAVTHLDGTYAISFVGLADGDYEIFPDLIHWGITSAHDIYDVALSDSLIFMDTLDFGMFPSEWVDSIGNNLTGWQFPRCLDTLTTWISTKNLGTTFPSGIIHLELAEGFNYVTAEIAPDSVSGQNIYWSFETLNFFEEETFLVQVATPIALDSIVSSFLTSSVIDGGIVVFSVTDTLKQTVICSYDPNDKTAEPAGEGPDGNIEASTEWIEYTVRFQNTGTDYAEDVVIRDQLDDDLIWTSIQPLFSSHDMVFEFDPSGHVTFVFNDIMLLDSNTNEIESHGFVKYRIKLKPDLEIGTRIENTAYIYFDYNPAVITNTALNTIAEPIGHVTISEEEEVGVVTVYPNPASDFVIVHFGENIPENYQIRIFNIIGEIVYQNEGLNTNYLEINTAQFDAGMYIIMVDIIGDNKPLYNEKLVIE